MKGILMDNVFVYFFCVAVLLVVLKYFYQSVSNTDLLALLLILVTAFYAYDTNRMANMAYDEMKVKSTPFVSISLVIDTIKDNNGTFIGIRPKFLIRNVGQVPLKYEFMENESVVVLGGENTPQTFSNLGGFVSVDSQNTFLLNLKKIKIENLINSKNLLNVSFKYWYPLDPSSQKYIYKQEIELYIFGELSPGKPNIEYLVNEADITKE